MLNNSSRLKSPNQSQISKLISQYRQIYYTEDFRNITHNFTISRFYAGIGILLIIRKACKPQPKVA